MPRIILIRARNIFAWRNVANFRRQHGKIRFIRIPRTPTWEMSPNGFGERIEMVNGLVVICQCRIKPDEEIMYVDEMEIIPPTL
jgi:hypothetical protein